MTLRGRWIAGVVLALLLVIVVLDVWGNLQARQFESLARAGKADASAALQSLRRGEPEAAAAGFTRARDEFTRARDLLGPPWLHGLPWLGHQLATADDLATIGAEGSAAGAEAARLLAKAGAVTGDDRLGQLLQLARPHVDASLASLALVAERAAGLSAEGLMPQLADAVTEAKRELEPMQLLLSRSAALLDLERYLFSAQHRFLLVSQNGAELRPTGGFMGTYGVIEFGPNGFHLLKYADIRHLRRDTLDLPIPAGGQVNYRHFWIWNTNWWMDFPTSAQTTLKFWDNLQQPQVDGVIAIDIPTIRGLLKVFGPISVPQSEVALTAGNVMEQLTYVVEYQMGRIDQRTKKDVVVSFAVELLHRIMSMTPEEARPFVASLVTSANEKHIQAFFLDPQAQASMVTVGWSGAISPPADTTDVLAVSNGVIKPSKANLGVTKTLDYAVALRPDGSADTILRLGYRKSSLLLLGVPQQWLANYVRAHRIAGTTQVGDAAFEPLDDATGLPTFGHYFRLDPGDSTEVVLHTEVPQAMRPGAAARLPQEPVALAVDGEGWHYRLLLAKQADLTNWAATVKVTVPPGWKVSSSAAWHRVSGTAIATSGSGQEVTLATPLKEDVLLDLAVVRG